jgi:hypothetical protein
MSRMLQEIRLLFQPFPLATGFSVRHKCDMKRKKIEELEARRALARELGSSRPLSIGFRRMLADLIDPDGVSKQCLRFGNRRRGNARDAARDSRIAEQIWEAGGKVEAAVEKAMKDFHLGRSTVLEIWSEWKPILNRRHRIYGPLTRDNIGLYWPR